MPVLEKHISLASIPDPPGALPSAKRRKLKPFIHFELLTPRPMQFFAMEIYDFALMLFAENLDTEMHALKNKETLFSDCYPFLVYLLALNLHRPLVRKYLARIGQNSNGSDLLLKYRFATVMGDKKMKAATARQCLALAESAATASASAPPMSALKTRIAELGALTNLIELAFFEQDFPRVRELASLFWKKQSALKDREAMRISSFYPLTIHKATAFTRWLDAKDCGLFESEEAKDAVSNFDQLIANPHSGKRFANFFYRIYANWLRIEFAVEVEKIVEFWHFFRHLNKGYLPAWQNVRELPRPRKIIKVTLSYKSAVAK